MNNWAEPPQWMLGKDAKGLSDAIGQCLLVQTRATADKTRELMAVVPGFPPREFPWNP